MIKKIVEIEAKVDKAVEGVEKVSKKVDELKNKSVEATDKLSDGVKDIGKSAKKTEKDVGGIAKGFKGVGVAIKAAGIGLVIGLLATLKEVFTSNQKVADAFAVAFETISLIFNQFANAVIDVYEGVASSTDKFDALKKVVMGLLTLALLPIKLAFYGIKLGIEQAQLIWEESFFGSGDEETIKKLNENIAETQQAIKDTALEAVDAGKDIVTNIVEAAGEVGNIVEDVVDKVGKISVKGAYESAKANVELQKAAEKAAVANQGLIEQYDRQAEQLRQIRDDDTKGINDRIEANDKLKLKLEEQKEKMLENAKAILAAAQAQFDKNGNDENAKALMEAKNELAGVEAQITGFMSEQMSNAIALEKERLDLTLSQQEAATALSIDQKRFNAEQIEDDLARLEALRLVLEEEKIIELERLQTKIDSYAADTQARADAEAEYAAKKQEINNELVLNDQEMTMALRANKQELMDLSVAALDQFIAIAGEESAIGKAMLVFKQMIFAAELAMKIQADIEDGKLLMKRVVRKTAEAGVDAATGAMKTTAAAPFPANLILIAGYVATAAAIFMSVKSAVSKTKTGVSVPAPSTSVGGGGGGATPRMPSFNMVGGSTGNQIAEMNQAPVKAFVVSGEVTTAQQLERNAVSEASI